MFSLPSFLASHVSATLVERFGWVLLHSLWQFTLLAVLAVAAARLLNRFSAAARYMVLLFAMLLMVVSPAATWLTMPDVASTSAVATMMNVRSEIPTYKTASAPMGRELTSAAIVPASSPGPADVSVWGVDRRTDNRSLAASSGDRLSNIAVYLRPWLATIVAAWCLGVVVFSFRPLLSWYTVTRLRRVGVCVAPERVRLLLERTARRLPLRRTVEVLQSTLINVPVVVGYVRPVILLPLSLVAGLPARQLEAILAHELAHIRRHDYLVNIVQTAVETLFFYHPGVWWLSSQIRIEREHCCDDLAVVALGDRVEYGRALLAIEELRGPATALALGANGGTLLDRVRRVLGLPVARPHWGANPMATAIVLSGVLLAGAWALFPFGGPTAIAEDLPFLGGLSWPQWGGTSRRNHVSSARNLPTTWNLESRENVKWTAQLGGATHGSPVVARGKVLIGTSNGAGRIARFPATRDVSCLQCFDEATGAFLWQFSSEKLPNGREQDWPGIGLCSTPCIVEDRVWLTTNRGEVVCLDLDGFRDEQNDGPITDEANSGQDEADVIWRFDMIKELGVSPQFQCCSSVTVVGDLVLLNTGHGPDDWQAPVARADVPSFLALDRHTGHVVWADASPGMNILGRECPSSSPAVGGIGDVMQAIFAGGDGWIYAFDLAQIKRGRTELLWKFDGNPKESRYVLGGQGTRNGIIACPVIHDGLVYVPMGQNPEHGEGPGHLWCIDATRRGDISSELVYNRANPDQPIPHKQLQACEPDLGDFTRPNPNSGVVWHYASFDQNGNGELEFDESLHRACGSVAISDGLAILADFSGIVHCLDSKTGRLHWTHDLFAAVWGTPLIADGKVYIGDEDGEVEVLRWSARKEVLASNPCESSIYSTPAIANGAIHLATNQRLHALSVTKPAEPIPAAKVERDVGSAAHRWPLFRGDPHSTGTSAGALPVQLDLLWQFVAPDSAFEATAVIDGDRVFIGDLDGTFHALDIATGAEKWTFTAEAGFKAPAGVRGGRVYVGDEDGQFYCLNAADGRLEWSFRTDAEIDGGPGFHKDCALVGSQDGTLYCLNSADGNLIWKHAIGDQIRCAPTVVENRAFLAGCDGQLHIIDLDDGRKLAAVPINAPTGCTPAVLGDRIYLGTEGGEFYCIDWRQAKVDWGWKSEKHLPLRSSPGINDQIVVFGGRDKLVHALSPQDGALRWTYPAKAAVDASPVIVGERAYVGLGNGRLVALDLATGNELWSYEAGGGFTGSPAVASGRLVIANDRNGAVYCFGKRE
jgi:outer membrane protein assembly factor BamB/beta-lactamase regulating signal transducer with metallopeptidase domain